MAKLMFSEVINFNIHGYGEYFIDYMKEETGLKLHLLQVIFLNVPLRRIVDQIFKILVITGGFRKTQNSCFTELCGILKRMWCRRCHVIILDCQPRAQAMILPKAISLRAHSNLFSYTWIFSGFSYS